MRTGAFMKVGWFYLWSNKKYIKEKEQQSAQKFLQSCFSLLWILQTWTLCDFFVCDFSCFVCCCCFFQDIYELVRFSPWQNMETRNEIITNQTHQWRSHVEAKLTDRENKITIKHNIHNLLPDCHSCWRIHPTGWWRNSLKRR